MRGNIDHGQLRPFPIRTAAANYTMVAADYTVVATAPSITITLPASPSSGQSANVKNGNGTAGQTITVAGSGGALIDGASSIVMDAVASIEVQWDGSQWRILFGLGIFFGSGGSGSSAVPDTRLINTTAPLTGGGDLTADRTLAVSLATSSAVGVVKPDGTTITVDGTGKLTAVTSPSVAVGVIGCMLTTGTTAKIDIPWNFTVTGWSIIGNTGTGSASVDVCFHSGSAPPSAPSIPNTTTDKISASAPVSVSSAASAAGGSSAISTWTTSLTQWGTVLFNPTSMTGFTSVQVLLFGSKS